MKKLLYIVSLTVALNFFFACSPDSVPENSINNDNFLQETPDPLRNTYHGDEDKDKDTTKP